MSQPELVCESRRCPAHHRSLAPRVQRGPAARPIPPQRPASIWVNGYYACKYTDTSQNREGELRSHAGRVFTRIECDGSGKRFAYVCRQLNKHCGEVRDWEDHTHACSAGAHDGSRMAYCSSPFPPGFYAYAETTTSQDREAEVRQHSNGSLIRLLGARAGSFLRLCRRIGRTCSKVVDWQGKSIPCEAIPGHDDGPSATDGSRMVLCSWGICTFA